MKNILNKINNSIKKYGYIKLSDEEICSLNENEINKIIVQFGAKEMIMLPEYEIKFYEWLKINNSKVWEEVWEDLEDENDNVTYTVSVNWLPILNDKNQNGFHICDLQENDNYFFTKDMLIKEHSEIIIDAAKERLKSNKKLTNEQILILEISLAPIDIWHFAYKYNINIDDAKVALQDLIADDAIIHLKENKYITTFIEK